MSTHARNRQLRAELDALRQPNGTRSIELGKTHFDLVATPLGSIANAKRWAVDHRVAYVEIRTARQAMGARGAVAVIVRAVDVQNLEITHEDIAARGFFIGACADPSKTFFFPAVTT